MTVSLPTRPSRTTRRRPKVVVLSTYPANPRSFGGQLRAVNLYGSLASLSDVELVSLTEHGRPAEIVPIAVGVTERVVPRSAKQARLEAEATARSGGFVGDVLCATLTPLYTPDYLDALRRALRGATAAILAHPFLLPCLRAVAPDLPFVYDAHNVEILLKSSLLPESADTMLALVREVEEAAVRGATRVFACSAEDRDALVAEYGVDAALVAVVPNGVDVDAIEYVDAVRRRDNEATWLDAFRQAGGWHDAQSTALFLGSDHMPNQEAVSDMLRVLPAMDGLLFVVAGWVGLPFLDRGAATEGAAFLGPFTADTHRVLLSSAAVGLNPVTRGSGTNLKTLEYFAAGLPAVSTPQGARGLDVRDGEHLRIANVDEFPRAIRALLDDPEGAAAMTLRARELVERSYAWPVASAPILDWVRGLSG